MLVLYYFLAVHGMCGPANGISISRPILVIAPPYPSLSLSLAAVFLAACCFWFSFLLHLRFPDGDWSFGWNDADIRQICWHQQTVWDSDSDSESDCNNNKSSNVAACAAFAGSKCDRDGMRATTHSAASLYFSLARSRSENRINPYFSSLCFLR